MSARVLVTAGAGGIGREICRAFAAQGARLAVCDVNEAELDRLAADLPGTATLVCDLSRRTEIERMVPELIGRLGGLDVLVNNAGIAGDTAPVESYPPAMWDQVMAVNLTAAFDVTRLALSALRRSDCASIINMSSIAGRVGYPNRSAYSASKWGLIGFTKSLAIELGEAGIRVNAILPGAVGGDRIERVFAGRAQVSGRTIEEERILALGQQSIKRLVDPAEIGALAVFLASSAGRSISGQTLCIDNDLQSVA